MFVIALLLAADTVGPIRHRLSEPVVKTFETWKAPSDLEICVADAVSVTGVPLVMRDGPDNVVITGSRAPQSTAVPISASIVKTPTGSRIDMRLDYKGWDERLTSRFAGCL
jgi:hypothetical protein